MSQAADHIRALVSSGALLQAVQQHGGALLIRGLPIETADDYSLIALSALNRTKKSVDRRYEQSLQKTSRQRTRALRSCPSGLTMNMAGQRTILRG